MWPILRFLWNATRGHRLTPWSSPYLKWRLETYTGMRVKQMGFFTVCVIMWHERVRMFRYLLWIAKMDGYVRKVPRND
jgi:hypothetical protein